MPLFERSLQKLAEEGTGGEYSGRLPRRLSAMVCRSREEATFFGFTWSMMHSERDFKLKVYPTVGLSLILPFIFILNTLWSGNGLGAVRSSRAFVFIYFCGLLMMTAVQMLRYSENYKAAWIYKAIPLPRTSAVYSGMLKALILRLLLPLFAVEGVLFLWLFGLRLWPHLIIVLLALLLYSVLCFRLLPQALPFSEKYSAAGQKEFTGVAIAQMFILLLFGGIHYVATLVPWGIYSYAPVLVIANWWIWRVSFPRAVLPERRIPTLRT
ncbi:hypothetical protein D3C73_1098500 [compost metagenome]